MLALQYKKGALMVKTYALNIYALEAVIVKKNMVAIYLLYVVEVEVEH